MSRSKKTKNIQKENAANLFLQYSSVSRKQREALNQNRSFTVWLTGLCASGKSSIAKELDSWFYRHGLRSYVLDGDNIRLGINSDLTFSKEHRNENIRRVAEICRLFNDAGVIVIASFISPFADDRAMAKKIIGEKDFVETFVDASIAKTGKHIEAMICWLDTSKPLQTDKKYLLRINAMETSCKITEVAYKVDVNTYAHVPGESVFVNEFAKVKIETEDTIAYDSFNVLPENGRGIIIDAETNYTAGAFVKE